MVWLRKQRANITWFHLKKLGPQQNIYLLLIPLIQPFLLPLLAVESSRGGRV